MRVWSQNIWFITLYYRYKERVNNSRTYERVARHVSNNIITYTNEIRKLKRHIYRIEMS